jgi:hypothetical protein
VRQKRLGAKLRGLGGILLAIAIFGLPMAAHSETRVALVIGNGGYGPSLGALANPDPK